MSAMSEVSYHYYLQLLKLYASCSCAKNLVCVNSFNAKLLCNQYIISLSFFPKCVYTPYMWQDMDDIDCGTMYLNTPTTLYLNTTLYTDVSILLQARALDVNHAL